jgi:hypothetical protein
MRAVPASRIEPVSASLSEYLRLGWLQAGFSSFAYRLAHLHAPRSAVVVALSVIFLAF